MLNKIKALLSTAIGWLKNHNIYSYGFYKSQKKLKRWLAIFATSFVASVLVLSMTLSIVTDIYFGKMVSDGGNINIEVNPETDRKFEKVINIMFYGLDSRELTEQSRSDAIMLVTIDQKHNKIKMVSIARDTRVEIPGYGKDKINHAFAYGWNKSGNIAGGAELSIKTVNSNFDLNVKNYATANFWGLAHIIDYIGGVDVDVDSAEKNDINKNYIPFLQDMGIECEPIAGTGKQHLTGGQAVAYCRVRHVGGTTARGSRHQEVLMALFEQVKKMNVTKYPELVNRVLSECSTSLKKDDVLSLAAWAVKNVNSLEFETLSIPTAEYDRGTTINGVWYHTYDLDIATKQIHDFILEPES
ncbi:MAG: LCP family protein [Clostridia bacterium]|nr:LCP family protein [Clostridia bacterium]